MIFYKSLGGNEVGMHKNSGGNGVAGMNMLARAGRCLWNGPHSCNLTDPGMPYCSGCASITTFNAVIS